MKRARYERAWYAFVTVSVLVVMIWGYLENRERSMENRQLVIQQCISQNATVEILRLFLLDHQDIRTAVPPRVDHPETLREIQSLLDRAECKP